MSSVGDAGGVIDVIELVEPHDREEAVPATVVAVTVAEAEDEITPFLQDAQGGRRMSIFSVSGPRTRRRLSKEPILGNPETEVTQIFHLILWIWSGSRYSGLLCMASSSIIYYVMEVFTDTFSGRSIPLFEVVFFRCIILSILSFLWVKSSGKKIFETRKSRNLLLLRALSGCLSLLSFIYSVQNLPLSYAVVVNFSTPLMASLSARIILQEKLAVIDVGGLLCGLMGLLFMFHPERFMLGGLKKTVDLPTAGEGYYIYPVLSGMVSSFAAGISYCLIRAAAKSSDQPVSSVLAFGVIALPVSSICMFFSQEFVLPDIFTFLLMVILGVLAFFAEVLLARGLQLEIICRAAAIQYLKVFLSEIWLVSLSRSSLSFPKAVGFVLVLASSCIPLYSKRIERETEAGS